MYNDLYLALQYIQLKDYCFGSKQYYREYIYVKQSAPL